MFSTDKIYQYNFPTIIRFGIGAIHELGTYLQSEKIKAPLIVTDPNVGALGFFKKIVDILKSKGLRAEVFSEVSKNPVKSDVLKGRDAYVSSKSDAIVGLGGGAAMDVARAIALSIHNRRDLFEYDDLIGGDQYISEPIPHFVTVPTTSGTGSEVGRSAIISEDDTKRKRILFHPTLLARRVFADPALTFGLSPFITAATGMDALTHNMEAYLAKGFHPMADGIALEGIRLIGSSLEKAVNDPDPVSRSNMMIASLMGAVAFQKGLGVVHSLAHPLSSLVDMHHGLANAICLPYGMEFNIEGFEDRFATLAQALGLEKTSGEAVVQALFAFNENIGLPTRLSAEGVREEHIVTLSGLADDVFSHTNNTKPVGKADFLQMYQLSL
jgi:alcohol dehydrogenase class IV